LSVNPDALDDVGTSAHRDAPRPGWRNGLPSGPTLLKRVRSRTSAYARASSSTSRSSMTGRLSSPRRCRRSSGRRHRGRPSSFGESVQHLLQIADGSREDHLRASLHAYVRWATGAHDYPAEDADAENPMVAAAVEARGRWAIMIHADGKNEAAAASSGGADASPNRASGPAVTRSSDEGATLGALPVR
jgi:hypothetical protein